MTRSSSSTSSSDEMNDYENASMYRRDELVNPYWIEDPDLGNGQQVALSTEETLFFKVTLVLFNKKN